MLSHLGRAVFLASCLASTLAIPQSAGLCSTGPVQCCGTVESISDPTVSRILGLPGIVVGDVTGLVGLNCVPVSTTNSQCSTSPVCCTSTQLGGLVNIGCTPVNLSL
ncbi:hydrophobin [Roridomyces roridus]|uniref:Hydrophobin n=1 Tax=Roridomyces roridus TaxID=1738132 RepID=A0AAD7FCB2_9AGAR|nr:hydrophobin [Roridomyces roridus]